MRLFHLLPACAVWAMACSPAFAQESGKQSLPPKDPNEWTYDGEDNNQDHWGELSVDYAPCLLGIEQSPVDIAYTDVSPTLPVLATLYTATPMHAYYRNNTLELDVEGKGNVLSLDKQTYYLKKITFHSPAEHTVRSKFAYGEIELLHEDAHGKILIISTLLSMGEVRSNALDVVLQQMPNKHLPGDTVSLTLDPSELLPEKRGYYAYEGSLTTPPCTEHVQWRVLKNPLVATEIQLRELAKYLGRNARTVQPVYNRIITETGE